MEGNLEELDEFEDLDKLGLKLLFLVVEVSLQNILLTIVLKSLIKYLIIMPPITITIIIEKMLVIWEDKLIIPKNLPIRHATFATIILYNIDLTILLALPWKELIKFNMIYILISYIIKIFNRFPPIKYIFIFLYFKIQY